MCFKISNCIHASLANTLGIEFGKIGQIWEKDSKFQNSAKKLQNINKLKCLSNFLLKDATTEDKFKVVALSVTTIK